MMLTKIDLKRQFRELYTPPRHPVLVDVPELSFLMVDGHGDPNTTDEYHQAIEVLYSVSYTLKFALKTGAPAVNYSVMPLEGLWWARDMDAFLVGEKSEWNWTAMIMQPDFITQDQVDEALAGAQRKRMLPAAKRLRFERFAEGLSAQIMYLGPYAEEGPTIAMVHDFIAAEGYGRRGKHHEVYLGDPRRCAPEKLRTVIRQPVGRLTP